MILSSKKIGLLCLVHGGQCVHTNHHPCCKCPDLFLSTDETSFEAGIKVQIHTQDEPPFIDQLGFGVAPGFQTFVSCQEQRVRLEKDGRHEIQEIEFSMMPYCTCVRDIVFGNQIQLWKTWMQIRHKPHYNKKLTKIISQSASQKKNNTEQKKTH